MVGLAWTLLGYQLWFNTVTGFSGVEAGRSRSLASLQDYQHQQNSRISNCLHCISTFARP